MEEKKTSYDKQSKRLILPLSGNIIDLKAITAYPMLASFSYEETQEETNGFWFEWVIGFFIAQAGLSLVQMGVTIDPFKSKKGREGYRDEEAYRDELDITTYHNNQFAYWSIKTKSVGKAVEKHFREACFQATRFLGRESQAVLMVPYLKNSDKRTALWPGMIRQDVGHYRDVFYGDVVDCSFLMKKGELNAEGIKELTCFKPIII
jgi:hypothetical protein